MRPPLQFATCAFRRLLFFSFLALLSVPLATGQVSFFQPPALSPECGPGVLSGDFNGDGKTDVICASGSNGAVLLGNGNGTFRSPISLPVSGTPVAAADFNGDGKLDLLVFGNGTTFSILLGNGDGTFRLSTTVNPGLSFQTMAVGDLRNDGKVDVVGLAPGMGVYVFLGNGDGTLQNFVIYGSGLASVGSMLVADFNGDGKLDVAVGGSGSNEVAVLLGNGDGTLQAPSSSPGTPSLLFAAADFTGNHILDLVVTSSTRIGPTEVLLGKGDGTFQAAQSVSTMTPYGVGVADLNGDGKTDLVISGVPAVQTFLGKGDGTFTLADTYNELLAQVGTGGTPVLLADFNGDGKLDAIAGGTVFLGNGDGSLQGSPEVLNPDSLQYQSIAVGDFNGDGKPDIATFSDNRAKNVYILLNQGASQFSVAHTYTLTAPAGLILAGDLNNDQKLDLVVVSFDPITGDWTLNVMLGNGDGSFTGPNAYPQGIPVALSPVLADFNGDHRLDLALIQGDNPASVVIFFGNGDGTFGPPVSYFAGQNPVGLVAADFNGDGKIDLAVVSDAGLGILLGNGDGTFKNPTYMSIQGGFVKGGTLLAGDLNGDGNIDLIAGSQVFLGKGDGTFTPLPPSSVTPEILADVNGDGKLDALWSPANIALGNGDGTFGNPITVMQWYKYCCFGYIAAAADFSGKVLPDLAVVTNVNAASGIMFLLNNTPAGFAVGPATGASTSSAISAGDSATFNLMVTPSGGFKGSVSLSCGITPSVTPAPTCNVPTSVSVTVGTAAPFMLTVNTTKAVTTTGAVGHFNFPYGGQSIVWALCLLPLGLLFVRQRKRLPALATPVIFLVLTSIVSCGGGGGSGSTTHTTPGTPSGTYTVTVTASFGNVSHSTTVKVVVQ